ncbi:MAG: thiamine pyrophosphate-dependent enzyme, partial [Clostridia bacterium]|nr:thiamine pyrophosphate-dependent enzyme [Clostridia bacterium]
YLVKDAQELPRIFKEAFYIASTGRPGPVLIDVPVDVQTAQLDFAYPKEAAIRGYRPSARGHALQIKRAAEAVFYAKRPVICAGGGVFASKAQQELAGFAEKCAIPVVTTMMGIGALPTCHPLHLGMLGTHGRAAANRAIHEADLLVICGARVGDRAMAAPGQIAQRARIIHIDIDPAEIGKNIETEIPIVGDLRLVLRDLAARAQRGDTEEWVRYTTALAANLKAPAQPRPGFIEPRSFIRLLSERMRPDAVLVADVGQNQIWAANNVIMRGGRFLTSGGMGTMGYAIPAALGVISAQPSRQVVAVCGDGSFQMSMMELATIMQQHAPLKVIVMRNDRLGMVCELQKDLYGKRYVATTLDGNPDFIALAAAYGIAGARLCDSARAGEAIGALLEGAGPYLLECAVDPEESSF